MTGNEYQEQTKRTNDKKANDRLVKALTDNQVDWDYLKDVHYAHQKFDVGGVFNACLGLSGEVGELNDMVKKTIFHEKPLDEDHLKKELGDVMWYVAMMCESMEWDLDEIMQMNIDKLKARYPEGFDPELANNRKEGDV